MRITRSLTLLIALLAPTLFAWAQPRRDVLQSGTEVKVRTDEAINATVADAGHDYPATVSQDVLDANGNVAIPRGSRAMLALVRGQNQNEVALDLRSITANGRTYAVDANPESAGTTSSGTGIGKNKRTGEYVGGGALAGTVIGAIAGGAKGAVIGAVAGGAAGAGAQVLTKGHFDVSPSYAPNGAVLIYASRDKGRGVLALVSADGRVQQRLVSSDGELQEPAWAPF